MLIAKYCRGSGKFFLAHCWDCSEDFSPLSLRMGRIMKMLSHLLDVVLYSSIAAFVCMLALNDELAFLLYSVDMRAKYRL